ncbi:MAG: hypothetical protein A2Z21_04255 [Candidatus Fraserbacteria bacterium RBG_16_55_9]|uniref:CopG-like ribbon-helix-helix domain-containing protein n=1 Tax=Fraserbacteria sp. (strain RBG_16_55_9) TaxID=1817864 RepID=A0A1F5UNZ6_FRAXR|nr:MAG: hypothetical protein A2Z21_04255 [Candidatus Fraserbacteria bacterium RBG_16_55_9]
MANRANLTLSLPKKLRSQLEAIAHTEKRSLNNLVELALEDWLELRETLHPQFMADIKEARVGVKRGEIEPVWKG